MQRKVDFTGLKAQYARLKPEIATRVQAVLDHGQFILGPEVIELEQALAAKSGATHAIAVSSGTDALLMALMADNVGPGDAVFVPAFTFTATAEVILLLGATPIFVDVDMETFNIDPGALEHQIKATAHSSRLQPRAVIAVDLFGQPAHYPELETLSKRYDLLLIADAAQSFGATLRSHNVGTLAPVTTTSFFPAKPLGAYGDGGAILTNDNRRVLLYRSIRAHGRGEDKYEIMRVGLNARLDTIQAAILLAKLTVFDEELLARERLSRIYDAHLGNFVKIPKRSAGATSTWAQYCVLVERRTDIVDALKEAGVPTAVYYPRPMHIQAAYSQFSSGVGSFPNSEYLAEHILALPMNPYLDDVSVQHVCDSVIEAVAKL